MDGYNNRWKRSEGSVYNVSYHIIFCPKYRKKVLTEAIEARLRELIYFKANEMNWKIGKMEIMPDHVHIFLRASPYERVSDIIRHLKGYTSRVLRAEFPNALWMKTLWTRSYYVETIGHISETTIKKYIEEQKTHG